MSNYENLEIWVHAYYIVSSELEELTALCDRILVLSNRKVVATFESGQWSNEQLLAEMFSAHRGQRAVNH